MQAANTSRSRPILFSSPMVRAILAGSKTQTRRVVKPQIKVDAKGVATWEGTTKRAWCGSPDDTKLFAGCFSPYGQPGDRLWVRETWGLDWYDDGQSRAWKRFVYRADAGAHPQDNGGPTPWRPSIHMPRAASRITLEITGVRVERLQDISEADAMAEGITFCERLQGWHVENGTHFHAADPRESYWSLWEAISGPGSVEQNPWAWVIEFSRSGDERVTEQEKA